MSHHHQYLMKRGYNPLIILYQRKILIPSLKITKVIMFIDFNKNLKIVKYVLIYESELNLLPS